MTRKRFKKLFYKWILDHRECYDNLGQFLRGVWSVKSGHAMAANYQKFWNALKNI